MPATLLHIETRRYYPVAAPRSSSGTGLVTYPTSLAQADQCLDHTLPTA